MSWDTGLQGPARNIAGTDERRVRVVAGPGTGKSFALKRRVARLLEQGQDPTRVMVVTFTRNAAASLVNDLTDLNVAGCEEVQVGTLHSFCFQLLNREDVFEYLARVPRPIISLSKSGSLQFEGGVVLSDLRNGGEFGNKRDMTKRIRAFEAAWARLQSEQPGWPVDPTDQLFEEQLLRWMRFHRSVLIGELVPLAFRFLRGNPASDVLSAFDHVIVDEYQDLNRAEQEIIDLLARGGSSAVVGDPDQSIYSFRYANPEGVDDYPNRHPTTYDESLKECRRCPTRVVRMASELIGKNYPPGSPVRLEEQAGNPQGEIHIVQWADVEEEAKGIAEFTRHLVDDRGYAPSDIMVITPRRKLAYEMRNAIGEENMPVYSFYQEEALEEEAAQRAFALLSLLANPEDRVALRWWLGYGAQDDRSPSYKILRNYCEKEGVSPREVLESIVAEELKLPGTTSLVKRYNALRQEIAELPSDDLGVLVERLFPTGDEACAAMRDIAILALDGNDSVSDLFNEIRTRITQPEVPDGDFVRVMSPQKAKGLTSRVVIVAACIEGLLPVEDRSLSLREQDELIREQRRLFYVAVTRCTDVLVLSSFSRIDRGLAMSTGAVTRSGPGRMVRTIASRFIDELGGTTPAPLRGSMWRESGFEEGF